LFRCFWFAVLLLQCRLYELNNGKRITVRAASKLLSNTMFSYRGMGLSMVSSAAAVALDQALNQQLAVVYFCAVAPLRHGHGLVAGAQWQQQQQLFFTHLAHHRACSRKQPNLHQLCCITPSVALITWLSRALCTASWLLAGAPPVQGCTMSASASALNISCIFNNTCTMLWLFRGLQGTMVAGWDPTGPGLYYVDSDGQRTKGQVFSVGSGSLYAYGVLDSGYKW
jgi:hypothetical protein